ncbi:peptidoglycan editing factor PgeF [Salinimonas lutimaris]|uniref:peptidoglycan editing factor PgeF n=1 Tax=Salinimonas lutimaris TaxID=914153 RepID=UPI0010C0C210|nr:peptidoglycan editing factor PgeF [Salinimonas lutimaris]
MNRLPLIRPDWPAPGNITAYSTTREGGVSGGRYSGLNVGAHVDDDPDHVTANRNRLPGAQQITWLNQVHGHTVVTLPTQQNTSADAAISRAPNFWCAVMTADCVPVLLCNRQGTEVAAVHAGWQGLEQDVISHTLYAMQSSPADVLAWIGPAISQACYQVDDALARRFSAYAGHVAPDPSADNKYLLDLPGIAAAQLTHAGVGSITNSALCTYSDAHRLYSHRRAQHEQAVPTGRLVSVIGLA